MDKSRSQIHNYHGFTMVEILVVVALMGILAAVAGPRIGSGMRGAEVKTSVRRFAAALRAARTISVTRRARIIAMAPLGENTCEFRMRKMNSRRNTGKSSDVQYSGQKSASSDLPEFMNEPMVLEGDVKFLDFKFSEIGEFGNRGAVMFLPQGNSTGGVFVLGLEDGPAYEVSIDPVTGRVHMDLQEN